LSYSDDGGKSNQVGLASNNPATPASSSRTFGSVLDIANFLTTGTGSSHHFWTSSPVTVNLTGLNDDEKKLAKAALDCWHDVCNISFDTTSTSIFSDIVYIHDENGGSAETKTLNYIFGYQATVDIPSDFAPGGFGNYLYQTYLHETGHALGLGHSGPYNFTSTYTPTYETDAIYTDDTWQYSVMSYFQQSKYSGSDDYVVTPQMADIQAVDIEYGTVSTRSGDTTYGFNSTAGKLYDFSKYSHAPALTIYDTGGNDTLDCSGYSQNQRIDVNPGHWSDIGGYANSVGIYLTTNIENIIGGTGNDTIIPNKSLTGTLTGKGGNDTFDSTIFGLSGYTIADMNTGDKLHLTDATVSTLAYSFDGTTLTYGGGYSIYFSNSPGGHFSEAADPTGGVDLTLDTSTPDEPQSMLPVAIGGTATISHSFLWSEDPDNTADQLTYTIIDRPAHGTILDNGVAATSFTQADIDNGLVRYVENGDIASGDSFTFQLSDLAGNHTETEPFRIAILDHSGPVVATNNTLSVPVGGNAGLNPFLLDTVALDNTPDQMTYTLLIPPGHGLVLNGGAPATSFTQADIDNGRIGYVENGDAVRSDSFIFQVSDAAGNHTVPQRFTIEVQGVSSDLVLSSDGSGTDVLASGTERQPADPKFTFDDVSAPVADASNGAAPAILDLVDATGSGQGSDTSTSDATTYWVLMQPSSFGDCQG
jgi:hypothetical protein